MSLKFRDFYHYREMANPGRIVDRVANDANRVFVDFEGKFPLMFNDHLIGIEIEAENFDDPIMGDDFFAFWRLTQDGSLRNSGIEFVSIPMKGRFISAALSLLWEKHKDELKDLQANARTGIHVHVDFRDNTIDDYLKFVSVYSVFENSLFRYSGGRANNIFCLPLQDTANNVANIFSNPDKVQVIDRTIRDCHKYMAINFKPLREYGTIEFRHMATTFDFGKIMGWVNMILAMKEYAIHHTVEDVKEQIFRLNSDSEYRGFGHYVFGQLFGLIDADDQQLKQEMELGVSYVKELFVPVNILDLVEPEPEDDEMVHWDEPVAVNAVRGHRHILDPLDIGQLQEAVRAPQFGGFMNMAGNPAQPARRPVVERNLQPVFVMEEGQPLWWNVAADI